MSRPDWKWVSYTDGVEVCVAARRVFRSAAMRDGAYMYSMVRLGLLEVRSPAPDIPAFAEYLMPPADLDHLADWEELLDAQRAAENLLRS